MDSLESTYTIPWSTHNVNDDTQNSTISRKFPFHFCAFCPTHSNTPHFKFLFIALLCFRKWKIENGKWKMILTGNSNHKIFSFSQKILEIPQIVSTICCSILNPSRRDTDILHYTFSIFHYSDLRDRRER